MNEAITNEKMKKSKLQSAVASKYNKKKYTKHITQYMNEYAKPKRN